MNLESFLAIFDLLGTFVFAITGALVGIRKRNDLYGVFFLAVVTALGGGMLRDTMLGRTPPIAFQDFSYLAATLAGALITWFFHPQVERQGSLIRILDAIGLALFSVIGAQVTLEQGGSWYAAIGFGIMTGTGGGMIRDVLAGQVPLVLQREIYAVASLAGASFYVAWIELSPWPPQVGLLLGMAVTGTIRLMAIVKNWNLPQVPPGLEIPSKEKPPAND